MVLVQIFAVMGENDVWRHFTLKLFEALLDLCTTVGEKTVLEFIDNNRFVLNRAEELRCAVLRLARTDDIRAKYSPIYLDIWKFSGQTQHSSAATYLNIVAVSAETENCLKALGQEA